MALDPAIIAAIVSGGAAITGSLGSAGFANAKNRKLQEKAFEYERQMIAEQNAYNSPLSVLGRYNEAGLNPNLIYGDSGNAGMQTSHAQYRAPEYSLPDQGAVIGNIVNQALAFALNKKELDLKEQELQNKREEQFRIRAERMARDIENMFQATITGFDPGLVTSQQERDMVLGGMRIGRYKAETSGMENLAALRDANKKVAELDAKQKQWVFDNINPLTLQLTQLDLDSSNLQYDLDKILYEYEKDLHTTFGNDTGKVDKIISVLKDIISIFVPKVSISSGNVGKTTYRRKNITYP